MLICFIEIEFLAWLKKQNVLFRLPIDGPSGEPLYAEAAVAGRKKEAVLECAQEACRMLDAAGLLRQSSHGKNIILKHFCWLPKCIYFGLLVEICNYYSDL